MKYLVKRPVHVDGKRREIGDTITRKSDEDAVMQSLVDCGHLAVVAEEDSAAKKPAAGAPGAS